MANFSVIQETQVSQLQSKLRKAQAELAEAEERADLAESSLSRAAGRNRGAAGRVTRTVSWMFNWHPNYSSHVMLTTT